MNREERRKLRLKGTFGTPADRVARGFAAYRRGDLAAAETLYRQALRDEPDHPDGMRLLGELLADRRQWAESIELLQRLVTLQPKNFIGHYSLANAFRLAGRDSDAIRCYQASLRLNPGFAGALHGLGASLRKLEREAEAVECFRHAVRAKPDWAVAWKDMGVTLAMLGEMQLAEASLRRAAQMDPGLGDAQRHLAAIRQDSAAPEELAALEAKCADPKTPVPEKIEMRFTLGQLEDKAGRHETAFAHFSAGNALIRAQQEQAGRPFSRARLSTDIDRLIELFTPEFFASFTPRGDASETMVFIVGMPRAGSTLFEQIATSHSQVFGAGERFDIGKIAKWIGPFPSDAWTQDSLGKAAGDYLGLLRPAAGNASRIIDKMPDNIFLLGLVAVLYPNARIIFCARDARDVALSCFFQNFAQSSGFDTDLKDCAFRIRETARATAHWQRVLPLRHMVMDYERLLAEPEAESRRLIAFLGLDWEPQCLDFHTTRRPVRTASLAQVRRPIYQSSVGRWRNYEKQLEGLEF